jgi:hypothetical protein
MFGFTFRSLKEFDESEGTVTLIDGIAFKTPIYPSSLELIFSGPSG